jgi:hypothetical protein
MAVPMIKPSHRGLLHKKLGVPQDEKIPEAKIAAAKRSKSPALRKEATFAQNFGHKAPQAETTHPQSHAAFEALGRKKY